MNREQIHTFLSALGVTAPTQQSRSGWVVASCPVAPFLHEGGGDKHPSFGVKVVEEGTSWCKCFSCGTSGSLVHLVEVMHRYTVGGINLREAEGLVLRELMESDINPPDYESVVKAEPPIIEFPEPWLSSFVSVLNNPTGMAYLGTREIDLPTVKALDLRYDGSSRRVCFPVRDWVGRLVGLHGRAIDPDKVPPYYVYRWNKKHNNQVWLGESWVDPDKPVLLVESVFDLASCYRVYKNVMCGFSSGLGKMRLHRVSGLPEVVTLYDVGTGGDSARAVLRKTFSRSALTQLVPGVLENDPGQMPVARIREVLEGYLPIAS